MTNVSLACLSLSVLAASPVVLAPAYSRFSSVEVCRSAFSRSLASFARCYFANNFRLGVDSCRFRGFLDSAIVVEGIQFVNQTFHEQKAFSGAAETKIVKCWFDGCHTKDSGGAVYIAEGKTALVKCTIDKTSFSNCSALQGGALAMNSGLLTISSSCFVRCSARNYGQAFVAISRKGVDTGYAGISVAMCPSTNVGGRSSMSMMRYGHQVGFCNSSDNANNEVGVTLRTVDCTTVFMKFVSVRNCSGINAFHVEARDFILQNAIMEQNVFRRSPIDSPNGNRLQVLLHRLDFVSNQVNPSGRAQLEGNLSITLDRCYISDDVSKVFLTKCMDVNARTSTIQMSLSVWYSDACKYVDTTESADIPVKMLVPLIVWVVAAVSICLMFGGIMLIIAIYCRKRKEVAKWAIEEGFGQASHNGTYE